VKKKLLTISVACSILTALGIFAICKTTPVIAQEELLATYTSCEVVSQGTLTINPQVSLSKTQRKYALTGKTQYLCEQAGKNLKTEVSFNSETTEATYKCVRCSELDE